MNYTANEDVHGEVATSDGLVTFEIKAGTVSDVNPAYVVADLVDAGLLVAEPVAPKGKKTTTVEATAPDVAEEN